MAPRSKWWITAAATCALLGCAGLAWYELASDDAPETTQAAEAPGRAVIYPDGAEAQADLNAALAKAAKEKKRVLIVFGGNWCGDCQVLEIYFHDAANRSLLEANYVVVPVNIGRYDVNLDLATKYGVPLEKGVPALAVLDSHGQLLYSQRHSEFTAMRRMDSSSVTEFLQKWKG